MNEMIPQGPTIAVNDLLGGYINRGARAPPHRPICATAVVGASGPTSMIAGDRMTQLAFSVYENNGVFAVLLGSGLSRAAEIPSGWEITLDLVRWIAVAQGVEEQADWAVWYREKTGQEPDYSALLEELAASPEERRSILHSYIEPSEQDREQGRKIPTAAHHAIADLVRDGYIYLILTTNFDRLLETRCASAASRQRSSPQSTRWPAPSRSPTVPATFSN